MIRRFPVALMVALSISACTSRTPQEAPRRLYVALSSEPVTLDPSQVEDGLGFRVIINLMEGLMGFNNRGELEKRLAESVVVSPDFKTYRFKLKPDAKWSDGVPIEAEQFRIAIERALTPKVGAKLSGLLKWIVGGRAFSEGKAKSVSGIEIKDREILIRLEKPISFFEQVMALPMTYPLRQDVLTANGGKWNPRQKGVPTNGAYKVRSAITDQEILLEAARPLPEKAPLEVSLRIVSDESTATTLFEEGKLDVLNRVSDLDLKRLDPKGVLRRAPLFATYFLSFNLKKKPFDQREFRQALSSAIRREELAKALSGDQPANSWIPVGQEGFYPASLEELKPSSKPLLKDEITIAFDSSSRNSLVMEKIQADLKAAYGWKTRLKNMDWKAHVHSIFSDPEMIFRFGWSSPMQDPALYFMPQMTGDPFSFSHYSNPEYDRLVSEILGMKPSNAREAKMIQAQKLLTEKDVVIVPIYHYVSVFAVGPRISKFEMSPLVGTTLFEDVEFKP